VSQRDVEFLRLLQTALHGLAPEQDRITNAAVVQTQLEDRLAGSGLAFRMNLNPPVIGFQVRRGQAKSFELFGEPVAHPMPVS
jgi:hypothetical protein